MAKSKKQKGEEQESPIVAKSKKQKMEEQESPILAKSKKQKMEEQESSIMAKSNKQKGEEQESSIMAKSKKQKGEEQESSIMAKSNKQKGEEQESSIMAKSNKLKGEEQESSIMAKSNKLKGEEQESSIMAKSNKQKGEEDTLTVKMQTLSSDPDKISPIVGYFASGHDPFTKNSAEQSEATVRVYRNTIRSNRLQLAVSQNGSPVDFVGTNYSGEATAPQLCNYAIGVLDKETQTLKIVPIAGNKVIRLDPKVAGVDMPEDENLDKKPLTAEEKSLKTRALTEMYSNKKSIRKAKKLDTLREQADAGAQHVEGNELINQEALNVAVTATDGGGRNIPPHDMDATTHETAYPLDKIIAKGEWDYLSDIFDVLEAGERIPPDVFPSFVCNRTYKLADIKDETQKRRMAGIFSYITHLVKFKDKHSMDGISSAKHHKIPGMLLQKFSSLFGVSESKRLPAEKIDLLISYVLVLTLHADNFRSDPSDIAKDLRMSLGDLGPRLLSLGCKFIHENRVRLATLPLPLQFTTTRKKRRK